MSSETFMKGYDRFREGDVLKEYGGKKIKFSLIEKVKLNEDETTTITTKRLSKNWFIRQYQVIKFRLK